MSSFKKLIVEIHRRSLWQVVLIYIGGAWACYEIIDTVTDRLALPAWLPVLAIVLFLFGLPFVVATAFVREDIPSESAVRDVVSPERAAQFRAAREEAAAHRRFLTWRNLGLAFVFVLAGWGAVAAGWLLLGGRVDVKRSEAARAAASVTRVAVLPFAVRGSDEIAYLGDGMVNLLSTALDGAGELSAVDPYALMRFLASGRGASADPKTGEAVAQEFGAGRFVLGSIVEAGGRLQVNASLYSADGQLEISAEETADDEGQVFDLVNSVARQLLAAGMGGPNARLNQVAAATTRSLPALKAYLEGESEYRAARFVAATAAYERAIAEDSTFALAWYRLAFASLASPVPSGISSSEAAEQAVRFSGRLSQRDRDRLAVIESFLSGDLERGAQRVRAILRVYPDDMEAWYYLGEFLFHYGGRRGRSIDEAGDAFEQALHYDPDHFPTLMHLSWVRSIQYRIEEFQQLLERMAEIEQGSDYPQFSRPVLAFLNGGAPAVREIIPDLWTESGQSIRFGAMRMAALDDGLPTAVELAGLLTDPSRPVWDRRLGYAAQASFEMAQGRFRAAAEVFDRWEAQGLEPEFETALEKRAVTWTSDFMPLDRPGLERLSDRLSRLDYDTVFAPLTRPYLLGLVKARLGRPAETLRYASQLENRSQSTPGSEPSRREAIAAYFAIILRAQVAADDGDYEEALRLLDDVNPQTWWALVPVSMLLSQAQERFLRSSALEALGRYEEALVWYASFGWVSFGEALYVAPAILRMAKIYERLGDLEQAAFYYRRFVNRWHDCDPELRPILAEAEQALARLTQAESP